MVQVPHPSYHHILFIIISFLNQFSSDLSLFNSFKHLNESGFCFHFLPAYLSFSSGVFCMRGISTGLGMIPSLCFPRPPALPCLQSAADDSWGQLGEDQLWQLAAAPGAQLSRPPRHATPPPPPSSENNLKSGELYIFPRSWDCQTLDPDSDDHVLTSQTHSSLVTLSSWNLSKDF